MVEGASTEEKPLKIPKEVWILVNQLFTKSCDQVRRHHCFRFSLKSDKTAGSVGWNSFIIYFVKKYSFLKWCIYFRKFQTIKEQNCQIWTYMAFTLDSICSFIVILMGHRGTCGNSFNISIFVSECLPGGFVPDTRPTRGAAEHNRLSGHQHPRLHPYPCLWSWSTLIPSPAIIEMPNSK